MRAEDLFEAMDGIDEKLIARSDRRRKSSRNSSEQKNGKRGGRKGQKRKAARIYRYAVVVLTAAAAVFVLLMVKDFVAPRPLGQADQNVRVMSESTSESDEAIMEPDSAAEEEMSEAAEEVADAESAQKNSAAADQAAGEAQEADSPDAMAEAAGEAEDAGTRSAGSGKSAVDLLGKLKGDFVQLQYISAADESAGAERRTPDYSEEGERALSSALESGQKIPAIMADKGAPVYYVYLTNKNGKEDKVTFYENGYVSMDSIPGVVLKPSQEDFDTVMALLE